MLETILNLVQEPQDFRIDVHEQFVIEKQVHVSRNNI